MLYALIISLIILISVGIVFGARYAAKLVLVLTGLMVAGIIILIIYAVSQSHQNISSNVSGPTLNNLTYNSLDPVQFPVTVLQTNDGGAGSGMFSDKYPNTITIKEAGQFAARLGAYGASYEVWLAPKSWIGTGGVGVDGNVFVDLYPVGGNNNYGQRISYTDIPGCVGCMLDAAAPYFSNAKIDRDKLYNQSGSYNLTIPPGLQVTPISPTLITYTLPNENGLSTLGVAYYNAGSKSVYASYEEAKFILSTSEIDLSKFMLQNFISQRNLK